MPLLQRDAGRRREAPLHQLVSDFCRWHVLLVESNHARALQPVRATASRDLLRESEAQYGELRLDLGPARTDHGDVEWTESVYGESIGPWTNRIAQVKVGMDGDALLNRLMETVEILQPEIQSALEQVAFGWTSIPVFNACAVRRGDAIAVVLNHRLSTVLGAANAIFWDIDQAKASQNSSQAFLLSRCRVRN